MRFICVRCKDTFLFAADEDTSSNSNALPYSFSSPLAVSRCSKCNGYYHTQCDERLAGLKNSFGDKFETKTFTCYNCSPSNNDLGDSLVIPLAAYIANEQTQEVSDSDSHAGAESEANGQSAAFTKMETVENVSIQSKEPWGVKETDNLVKKANFSLESEKESEKESDTLLHSPHSDSEIQQFIQKCSCCHQFRLSSDQQTLCIHCEAEIVHTRCFHRWFHERSQLWPNQIMNQIGPQWKAHAQLLEQKQRNVTTPSHRKKVKYRTSERSNSSKNEMQWREWLQHATKTLIFCADCVYRQLASSNQKEGFIAQQIIGQVVPITLKLKESKQTLQNCSRCRGSFCISPQALSHDEAGRWECIHCMKTPFIETPSDLKRLRKSVFHLKQRKARTESVKRIAKKPNSKRHVVKVETPIQWPQPVVVRESLPADPTNERFVSLNNSSLNLTHGLVGDHEAIHMTPNECTEKSIATSLTSAFRPSREPHTLEERSHVPITCDDCQQTYHLIVGKGPWTDTSLHIDDKEYSDRQTEAACGVMLARALDTNATTPPCSPWFCLTCLKRMKRSRKRKRFRYSKQMLLAMEIFGKRLETHTHTQVPYPMERPASVQLTGNRFLGSIVLIFSPIDRVWLQGYVASCTESKMFEVVFADGVRQSLPLDSLPVLYPRKDPLIEIERDSDRFLARLLHANKWAQHILSDEFSKAEAFFLVQLLCGEDVRPLGAVHYVPKAVCRPYNSLPSSPFDAFVQKEQLRTQQHALIACRKTAIRFPEMLLHAKVRLSQDAMHWSQVTEYDASSREFTLSSERTCARIAHTQLSAQLVAVDPHSLAESDQKLCASCRLPSMNPNESLVSCQRCKHNFHATCTDPPYVNSIVIRDPYDHSELESVSLPFICAECDVCAGCNQSRDEEIWIRWRLPLAIVSLCAACEPLYRTDQFCSVCYRILNALTPRKELSLLSCSTCRRYIHPECEGRQHTETSLLPFRQCDAHAEAQFALKEAMEKAFSFPVNGIPIPTIDLWASNAPDAKLSEEIASELTFDTSPTHWQHFQCLRCRQVIALGFIKKLAQQDKLQVFSSPVTREIAPASYFEIIKEPMDVATMQHKVLTAERYVDTQFRALQDDFELICFNAVTFNSKENDFWIWREAWRFYGKGLKLARRCFGTEHSYGDKYLTVMLQAAQRQLPPNSAIKRALLHRHESRIVQHTPTQKSQETIQHDRSDSTSTLARKWTLQTDLRPVRISLWETEENLIVMRWTRSFAHTYAWLDLCVVCASSDQNGTLVFCADCAQAVHTFCVISDACAWNRSNAFYCPNCIECRVCHKREGVLTCPKCGKGAHKTCMDPPIDSEQARKAHAFLRLDTVTTVYCGQCVECKQCQTPGASNTYSFVSDLCLQCCERQQQWIQQSTRQFTKKKRTTDKCPICMEKWDHNDALIQCDVCDRWMHPTCDPLVTETYPSLTCDRNALYVCPHCRKKNRSHLNAPNGSLEEQRKRWKLSVAVADTQAIRRSCHTQWKHAREQVARMRRWKHCQAHIAIYLYILRLGEQCLTKLALENTTQRAIHRVPQWLYAKASRYIRFKRYARGPRASERRKTRKHEQVYSLHGLQAHPPDAMATIVSQAASCAALIACARLLYGHPPLTPVVLHVLGIPVDRKPTNRNLSSDVLDALRSKEIALSLENDIQMIKSQYARRSARKNVPKEPERHIAPLSCVETRACALCARIGDESTCGRLLYLADVELWTHLFCALWAHGTSYDPILRLIVKCAHARSKSRHNRCQVCGHTGASIVCAATRCPRQYHFPCAVRAGCVFSSAWNVWCPESTHAEACVGNRVDPNAEIGKVRMNSAVYPTTIDSKQILQTLYTTQTICYRIGTLTVHSLGNIVIGNPNFHSETSIFPLGFRSTRIFWSSTPYKRCLYECTIRPHADKEPQALLRPLFVMVPSDDPTCRIEAFSAQHAVEQLYKRIGKTYRLRGDEFFGFGRREIAREIEMLPSAATTAIPSHRFWAPKVNSKVYEFAYVLPTSTAMKSAMDMVQTLFSLEHRALSSTGAARTDGLAVTGGKHAGAHAHVSRSFGAKQTTLASDKLIVHAGAIQASSNAIPQATASASGSGVMMDIEHLPMAMQYRELRRRPFEDRLQVCKSAIHGYGLFTKEALSEGQAIVEYQGELISQQVADVREALYEEMGVGSCYLFRLDATTIIDATTTGNLARFINHSCDPKAFARSVTVENDKKKILIFAKRHIVAGEEITYDYKFPIEEEALRCDCGAPNCVGRMN